MEFLTVVGVVAIFAGGYVAAIFTWGPVKRLFGFTFGS